MSKQAQDSEKAHNLRMTLIPLVNKLFRGSPFIIQKLDQTGITHSRELVVQLNKFTNRFSIGIDVFGKVGHSCIITSRDHPGKAIIVDIRFDNGSGVYWKSPARAASYEMLKMIDPIFIIAHEKNGKLTSIAVFDLNNQYMAKRHWTQGGIGNKNRLQNTRIPRSFAEQLGFAVVNGKCPELIEYLTRKFNK